MKLRLWVGKQIAAAKKVKVRKQKNGDIEKKCKSWEIMKNYCVVHHLIHKSLEVLQIRVM